MGKSNSSEIFFSSFLHEITKRRGGDLKKGKSYVIVKIEVVLRNEILMHLEIIYRLVTWQCVQRS